MQNTGKNISAKKTRNISAIAQAVMNDGAGRRRKRRCIDPAQQQQEVTSPERRRTLSLTLRDALIRAKALAAPTAQQQQQPCLPLEIMVMIASSLSGPGEAHALSLASKDWNLACSLAFPPGVSPRFVLHAIYENPARLAEVAVIPDEHTMMALCATVKDVTELARLARPATPELYNRCVKHATRCLNKEALTSLIVYGQERDPETQGGWALVACIETLGSFASSDDESAPTMFYTVIASLGRASFLVNELVRATAFRRLATGIKCLLRVATASDATAFHSIENVSLLLAVVVTMTQESLLLQMIDVFPAQIARIMATTDNGATLELVVRSGWTAAADAILSLVADAAHDTVMLLRYAVITGKTTLVSNLLFPRRRSTRRKNSATTSATPTRTGPVTLTDDAIIREAVILGHEDIATLLCTAAPYLVSMAVVSAAVKSGFRADFVDHLLRYLDDQALRSGSDALARTAINFKNYEVVSLLVTDYAHLVYTRETLLSVLNLLGPFKLYAPAVSILLHSPQFRHLL